MAFLKGFEPFVRAQEPMLVHTWLHIGGPAEYFAEPRTREELQAVLARASEENLPVRLLGGGSNILVRDEGVAGVVVRLDAPAFSAINVAGETIRAGGGARLGHVISTAVGQGLAGLEPLVGIPGTIGGALHLNAGTRGGDIGQWTEKATVMNRRGEILEHTRQDLVFAYRQSSLDELVILDAEFALERENPEELTKRMQKQWIVRKAAQPLGHQCAGQIFRNPRGMSAGQLIDQAGLKGARVGLAEVSDRHANFVIAEPNCPSRDVIALIEQIRERVADRLGVELTTDIEIW
jgi:UDP-N-acetylmuramate dehydrogenase